jgi:hypothetical protein
MTPDEHAWYTSHSAISDPAELRARLAELPRDPERLVEAVSGLVLHTSFVAALGITPPADSGEDAELRTIPAMLGRILARDAAPLDVARPPERRLVAICRDYALVACAALRQHGIPARLRVGFATYFTPDVHDDHWVCEYHAEGRWRLLDAELSEPVRAHFGVTFSPTDVPRDRFVSAGATWLGIRRGVLDPARCGVWGARLTGAWFVAAAVVRDLAALNKREVLGWDYWGITRSFSWPNAPVSAAAAARIDALADLLAGPTVDWKAARDAYEQDATLRLGPVVLSCRTTGPIEVRVPAEALPPVTAGSPVPPPALPSA